MGTSSSVPVPRGLEVLPDTVVMVASRDGFDVIMALAAGSVAATFFAILLGMAFLFVQARATVRRIESLRRSLVADPAVKSLRETAANVEAVSDTVRTELVRLTESLGGVSDRVDQASRRMEERIEEFNALMEVVQREAEDVFLDTAATARGIRHGVRGSRRRPANPGRPSPDPGPPGPRPAHTDDTGFPGEPSADDNDPSPAPTSPSSRP